MLGLLVTLTYRFPVSQQVIYQADMKFDGFLPILGVGQGKAEVRGTFAVVGKSDNSASVTLTAFEITFNSEKIPIDLDDARKYVPGGTFTYTPAGSVSAWDAPMVTAPIRVPGLDLKHLPEVLFLPMPFPTVSPEEGETFTFSMPLSGGTSKYVVTRGPGAADAVAFTLNVHQNYGDFEDDANQVVAERDAALRVDTDVVGTGTGLFNLALGRFTKFTIDDVATSTATDVQTKKISTRKLTRHLEVKS